MSKVLATQATTWKLRGQELDNFIRAAIDTVLDFSGEFTVQDLRNHCPVLAHPAHTSRILQLLRKAGFLHEVRREPAPGSAAPVVVQRSDVTWLLGHMEDPAESAFAVIRKAWTHGLVIMNTARRSKTPGLLGLAQQAKVLGQKVKNELEKSKVSEVKKLQAALKRERALLKVERLKKELKKLQDRRKKITQ